MGMSSGGGGKKRAPMGEINVTPLVDVMLVLLIIFMVAAPMLQTAVPVDLPQTRAPRQTMDDERLVLSVTAERRVYLGEEEIPRDRLEDALSTNALLREQDEIYVRGDASVPYGFMLRVYAAIRAAGVEKLGLVTDPGGGNRPIDPSSPESGNVPAAGEASTEGGG